MSLEAIIEANTAAVRDLIAALNAQAATGAVVAKAAAPAPEKKEPINQEAAAPAPAPVSEAKADEPPVDDAKEVTYDEAAKAVTALGKAKGRAAAVAVLEQFGAKNLQGVKPADFAAVVAACAEA